jgi:hypothetical protein
MLQYVAIPIVVGAAVALLAYNTQYSNIELVLFAFFMVVMLTVGLNYFLGVQVNASIKNALSAPNLDMTIASSDVSGNQVNKETGSAVSTGGSSGSTDSSSGANGVVNWFSKNQVFHVPGNFDYQSAKALCKAYGGKLASFDDMDKAHKGGADWCDYGWSDEQMVLYPTQYKTWQMYQKTDKKDMCGRPGVNGGYNNDLLQKLGANCFGPKPSQDDTPLPQPPQALESDAAAVYYWKSQLASFKPSAFNYSSWNS